MVLTFLQKLAQCHDRELVNFDDVLTISIIFGTDWNVLGTCDLWYVYLELIIIPVSFARGSYAEACFLSPVNES